jgi:hypothetical protein
MIAASASNPSGGSVNGAGNYALDAAVTLLATPNASYAFVNWTEDGVIVGSAATNQFPASANRTLVAHFAPTYSVSLASSSLTMGTVAGAGTYLTGSSVTAVASPKAGYMLVNWTESGTPVSTLTHYTFTVVSNRTLMANFAPATTTISPYLTFAAPAPGTLVLSWPTNATGFVLQQNSALGTTNWLTVTNAVNFSGTNSEVTLSPLTGAGFFRLAHP